MTTKTLRIDCVSCESVFTLDYEEELVMEEYPQVCPFCGDDLDNIQEEYIPEDDDLDDEETWE